MAIDDGEAAQSGMTEIGEFAADGSGAKGRDGLSAGAVLVVGSRRALWRRPDGLDEALSLSTLADRLATESDRVLPLHCYGAGIARRLGVRRFPGRDILDLFAFARPG
ncbi:MAG: hypothetical protein OXH59_11230, partial [Rhodospirillaceae bacterium]|nr:hypothetical protein [Rhodospirillaceae bacterium]